MINWLIGILMFMAGYITSLFLSREAVNFSTIQTMTAVILFTLFVIILAFWPQIKALIKKLFKQ